MSGAKLGKDDPKVRYRTGTTARHCAICTMFRVPKSCTAVAGDIDRDAVCNLFDRKRGTVSKVFDKYR